MNIETMSDAIIDMYQNRNMNTVQIADAIGCSNSSVGRLLQRHGVERIHTPNELNVEKELAAEICELYSNGMTTVELGKKYGVCDASIAKILRQNGITIRKAVRRSIVKNHDYFSKIDSVDKAYFLGWMISDGAIIENLSRSGRSRVVSLEIKETDISILHMYAESLGANSDSVRVNQKRGHAYLRFASNEMADDLAKYGVVPRKSHITFLPRIDKDMMPHLIRGIFDGDGTATIDKQSVPHFAFYGSNKICEDISQFLHDEIGIRKNKVSKSTCYYVWWGGNTPTKAFCDYIYNDCGKYYLGRKRAKLISQ